VQGGSDLPEAHAFNSQRPHLLELFSLITLPGGGTVALSAFDASWQPGANLLVLLAFDPDRACPAYLLTRNQQDAFGQRLVGLFILLS